MCRKGNCFAALTSALSLVHAHQHYLFVYLKHSQKSFLDKIQNSYRRPQFYLTGIAWHRIVEFFGRWANHQPLPTIELVVVVSAVFVYVVSMLIAQIHHQFHFDFPYRSAKESTKHKKKKRNKL